MIYILKMSDHLGFRINKPNPIATAIINLAGYKVLKVKEEIFNPKSRDAVLFMSSLTEGITIDNVIYKPKEEKILNLLKKEE